METDTKESLRHHFPKGTHLLEYGPHAVRLKPTVSMLQDSISQHSPPPSLCSIKSQNREQYLVKDETSAFPGGSVSAH